jgi:hypothetical protein
MIERTVDLCRTLTKALAAKDPKRAAQIQAVLDDLFPLFDEGLDNADIIESEHQTTDGSGSPIID